MLYFLIMLKISRDLCVEERAEGNAPAKEDKNGVRE